MSKRPAAPAEEAELVEGAGPVEMPAPIPFREVVRLGRLNPAPRAETSIALTEIQAIAWGLAGKRTLSLASGTGPVDPADFRLEAVNGPEDGVVLVVTNPAGETGLLEDNDACVILEG